MKLIPRWIRRPFEDSLGPIADRLIVAQVHPNTLTTLGFATLLASSGAFATGAVRAAGALLLLSGVLDMLDGKVARGGGRPRFDSARAQGKSSCGAPSCGRPAAEHDSRQGAAPCRGEMTGRSPPP